MGSKWRQILLGDLIQQGQAVLQTGPFGTALKADEYTTVGVPLISVREIRDGFIQIEESTPRVDESVIARLPKFVLKKGDIVFARKGGVERTAYISNKQSGWFIGSDGIYLRLSNEHDSLFFSYILRSPQVKEWLLKNCEGTTMPSLNQKILARIPINIPELKEQKKISEFLSEFDSKITLNRQINQTLEQMAQTLFKSWFVDFDPVIDNALDAGNDIPDTLQERAEQRCLLRAKADFKPLPAETRALFPSEFEETELGWVPKGWEGVSIANMCDMVTNGGTPNRATKEFWKDGDIPWYKTGEFSDGFLLTPSERITHAAIAGSSVKLLPENSVLMAIYAAPTVGRLGVLTETSAFNQACTGMVPKAAIGTWFLFLTLYFARDWFNNRANGAAQQNISKAIVENYLAIVPNQDVLTLFNKNMEDLFAKIRFNSEQIQRLSILRDTLLPKLISGELELEALPEAPELAEAG